MPPSVPQCYLCVDDVEPRGWGGDGCGSGVDAHYEGLLDSWRRETGVLSVITGYRLQAELTCQSQRH